MKFTLVIAFIVAITVCVAFAAPQDDNDIETDIQEVSSTLEKALKQNYQEDADEIQAQLLSLLSRMEQNDNHDIVLQGAAKFFAREQARIRTQGWRDEAIKKLKEAGKKLLDIIF